MQKVSVLSVVLAGRSVFKLQEIGTGDSDIMETVLAKTNFLYVKCKNAWSGLRGNTHCCCKEPAVLSITQTSAVGQR